MSVLSDYELHLLRRRNLSPKTVLRRLPLLRSLERWLDVSLFAVDAPTIEMFLDARENAGPRSRYHYLSDISCFFDWAKKNGLTDRNPAEEIDRPKLDKLLPRPISEENLATAIAHGDPLFRAWVVIAGYAGLRCMELAGLNTDDVLRDDGLLRIVGKGNKERLVPIHPLVTETLSTWTMPKRGPVFTRARGGRFPAETISHRGSKTFASLDIRATLHMCRHRFGTQTYRACRDIRVVQELMGHSSIQTTAGYVAFSREEARAAVFGLPTNPKPPPDPATDHLSPTGTDHWPASPRPRLISR